MSSADQLPSAAVSAVRPERLALDESSRASRVTVTVYDLVVPFSAVTSTASALAPTLRSTAPLALPDVTAERFEPLPIFTVAFVSATVAVSRASVVPCGTVAVYAVVVAENVPMSSVDQSSSERASALSPARSASADAVFSSRVTVTLYSAFSPFHDVFTSRTFSPTASAVTGPVPPPEPMCLVLSSVPILTTA